jgi:hypothetical protein
MMDDKGDTLPTKRSCEVEGCGWRSSAPKISRPFTQALIMFMFATYRIGFIGYCGLDLLNTVKAVKK